MAEVDKTQALEELKKRGIVVSSESVFDEEGSAFDEFKKATTSLLKGSAKGIVDLIGGWGTLYDYLNKSADPSALSSAGILKGIRDLGGPDLLQIGGYRGAYEVGQTGAPAAVLTAAGLPGLFGRTPAGLAGEFAVQGGTGALASTVAPDSPIAQLAFGSVPDLVKGSVSGVRSMRNAPQGQVTGMFDLSKTGVNLPNNQFVASPTDYLSVGRMTPGELTGNRPQLAKEAGVEANPNIEERGNIFRQAQAMDVAGYLDKLFKKATASAVPTSQAAETAYNAFNNYGKALSSKLRSDASKDFRSAAASGGKVNTAPILGVVDKQLSQIPAEAPGFEALKASLAKIRDQYTIPGTPAKVEQSTILGPTGKPASVTITPAVPAGVLDIDIDRLQKNLSAWGEAAWSGKADFGKGNIFEGVAPGQAKGVARAMLGGFKQALDEAIAAGVPGAEKLKKARDNFAANLDKIDEYSNIPIVKYFDVPTASSLTPELVIAKLEKAKPSERAVISSILNNHPDGHTVWDTVRRSELTKVLENSKNTKAAEGAPMYDLNKMLGELNKRTGDLYYLIPDTKQRANAALAVSWLQKVAKGAKEADQGGLVKSDVYAGVRGTGGTAQQGLLLGELTAIAKLIIDNPAALADVVFNPETAEKMIKASQQSKMRKAGEILQEIAKKAAVQAVKAGPRMDTTYPQEPNQENTGAPIGAPSPEEALQQLKALGIEVE